MKENPNIKDKFVGETDSDGADDLILDLSTQILKCKKELVTT